VTRKPLCRKFLEEAELKAYLSVNMRGQITLMLAAGRYFEVDWLISIKLVSKLLHPKNVGMSKKALQIVLAVLGLIPIVTGSLSIVLGVGALSVVGGNITSEMSSNIVLDSEIRFLGAIWLGVGVFVYWIIPSIDKQTTLFRLLMGTIFLGGVGRSLSAFLVGIPPALFIAIIVLELLGMPLLVLWQSLISTSDNHAEDSAIQGAPK
jgi:hypothetical protein